MCIGTKSTHGSHEAGESTIQADTKHSSAATSTTTSSEYTQAFDPQKRGYQARIKYYLISSSSIMIYASIFLTIVSPMAKLIPHISRRWKHPAWKDHRRSRGSTERRAHRRFSHGKTLLNASKQRLTRTFDPCSVSYSTSGIEEVDRPSIEARSRCSRPILRLGGCDSTSEGDFDSSTFTTMWYDLPGEYKCS
jgi:hypothetical protein